VHFSVETQDHVVYGQVYQSDGKTFANNLNVSLTVQTSSGSQTIATTTDLYGFYSINLNRLSFVWHYNDSISVVVSSSNLGNASYSTQILATTTQQIPALILNGPVSTTTTTMTTTTTTTTTSTTTTTTSTIISHQLSIILPPVGPTGSNVIIIGTSSLTNGSIIYLYC